MSRFLPRTLFGQTLLILLAGLILSQVVGAWIYLGARREAVRAVGGLAAAQRIANLTRLIEEAPADWRDRIVTASSDPGFRLTINANAPVFPPADDQQGTAAEAIEAFLKDQLSAATERNIRVRVAETSGPISNKSHPPGYGPGFGPGMMRGPKHGMAAWRGLEVALQLNDARWLSVNTALPDSGPAFSPRLILAIVVMAAIVSLVATLAVRRLVAPLGSLAAAADRIGRDVGAPPLPESGTVEMRQAAHAFNGMQERLRRLIENRTHMLAAISHDLRTELQLLRLRAEGVEPVEDRDKMLSTIAGMEAMLAATLNFARGEAAVEPRRRTDLAALVASVVDDMSDGGMPVTFLPPAETVVIESQPSALRRALTNLIDNAVKYGQRGRVSLTCSPDMIEIAVEDDGPGIPVAEQGKVLQPFYRLETSRSRETGGMGLGLAIAASVAESHGGELRLANRKAGGLTATLRLPR